MTSKLHKCHVLILILISSNSKSESKDGYLYLFLAQKNSSQQMVSLPIYIINKTKYIRKVIEPLSLYCKEICALRTTASPVIRN